MSEKQLALNSIERLPEDASLDDIAERMEFLAAQLSLAKSNSFVWLSFGAIPRSTYQVQFIATNLDAASGTNRWLTNTTLIPAAKPVSIAVSPYPTTNNKAFYRVRSLGRTPGN
jgi:hypothetical protein